MYREGKGGKHGEVNLVDAVARSCDVYFYGLAAQLGVDRIAAFVAQFGIGTLTGIDISGEKPGLLPTPEWKKQTFKRPQDQVWFPGETVNFGVGQGYLLVTPLQLAHVTAMLAERGQSFQPRVVIGVRDASGRIIRSDAVAGRGASGISEASWALVLRGMIGATTYGTAAAISRDAHYTHRRQDRHRAGVHRGAEREVQRQHGRRAAARPFVVHRLRAGRMRRASPSACWWRMAASAPAPPRRSRAACSTPTCSTRRPPAPHASASRSAAGRSRRAMMVDDNRDSAARRTFSATARLLSALKLDGPLLVGLGLLAIYALLVQYSASGQSLDTILRTLMRVGIGTVAMIALAQSSPNFLRGLAPWLYGLGIVLLLVVDAIGYVGKGAQRWLDVGLVRFQPSEIMKLAVPMVRLVSARAARCRPTGATCWRWPGSSCCRSP